jgi:outer membrane lipoprotein-sorting protein
MTILWSELKSHGRRLSFDGFFEGLLTMQNLRMGARVVILCSALACGVLTATIGMPGPDKFGFAFVRMVAAQSAPSRWETVKKQMDAASVKFQSAQAHVDREIFEKLVNDTTTQTGEIYFLRKGGSTQMGAKMSPPTNQTVEFKDGKLRLYSAGTNHLEEFATSGPNQTRFETFLTLGFGGSGSDLEKAWAITDKGSEQMSDGGKSVAVEQLDLVSKDPAVRSNYTHVTIWVDPTRGVSLKQKFFAQSGDTNTATYSNIVLNGKIDTGAFAIKCKGKCG